MMIFIWNSGPVVLVRLSGYKHIKVFARGAVGQVLVVSYPDRP